MDQRSRWRDIEDWESSPERALVVKGEENSVFTTLSELEQPMYVAQAYLDNGGRKEGEPQTFDIVVYQDGNQIECTRIMIDSRGYVTQKCHCG